MNYTFGQFLKQKRQAKNITQKELAKLLYVSESAVSKWENDIAHPDITLLPKLSEILDVTEHELITASIDNKTREEKHEARKWRVLSKTWNISFYIAYALAIIPCFICNLAINKTLSWFWIVLASLLLAFSFTNLPSLIKKHKLLLIPLSNYIALLILLATCAIYTNGNWFIVSTLSVLLGYIIIFIPIYINKYSVFSKIRKYTDFISIGLDFVVLNVLLIVIDLYCVSNGITNTHWYLKMALPIVSAIYLILNILLSVRFLPINKLLKTSIILTTIDIIIYIIPLTFKFNNPDIQNEFNDLNILNANLLNWNLQTIENNVHCIIFLTILLTSTVFLTLGLIQNRKRKHHI